MLAVGLARQVAALAVKDEILIHRVDDDACVHAGAVDERLQGGGRQDRAGGIMRVFTMAATSSDSVLLIQSTRSVPTGSA